MMWKVQKLETHHNDYEDWATFCIRSTPQNYCLAIVGQVDRATAPFNEANAQLMAAAPDLLAALELCFTRLFNYQAGMDDLRYPEATSELNREALDAAKAAIDAANGKPKKELYV